VEQTLQGWLQVVELGALGLVISWVLERSQRQTHRFRSMAASMADAVIAADRGGSVTYMNAQAEALLGTQLAKARRQPLKQLVQFRDHATGEPVEIAIDAVLGGESPASAAAKRLILNREGLDSEVEETIAPMRSRSGRVEGVILTVRDTTRRREA
jgi:PAS domain S-box-containing protein